MTIDYCFESNGLYCFPNPRWRLEKSDQSGGELRIQDGGPYKVSHVGKQPTSVNGGLESVSQISMATQITPRFSQKCHAPAHVTNFNK